MLKVKSRTEKDMLMEFFLINICSYNSEAGTVTRSELEHVTVLSPVTSILFILSEGALDTVSCCR